MTAAAPPVAEEHVAGNEGGVLGDPEHDLGRPCGPTGLEPTGERIAGTEGVRYEAGSSRDGRAAGRGRPHTGAVPLDHGGGAACVPEHAHENVDRLLAGALHVAVERFPEARSVLRRDERVDEYHAVSGLDVDAADVLLPLLVVPGPAPEAGGDLEHVHAATLVCVAANR